MFEVDNKTTWLHVRLTEKERQQLEMQMQNIGYRSKSKYARAKILDERIKIDKNVVLTDRLLRNQINALSALVAKIGVDYNQATKRFNSIVKMKRADGSPVIDAKSANYYLKKLCGYTTDLKDLMETIIDRVEKIELKASAEEENQ